MTTTKTMKMRTKMRKKVMGEVKRGREEKEVKRRERVTNLISCKRMKIKTMRYSTHLLE